MYSLTHRILLLFALLITTYVFVILSVQSFQSKPSLSSIRKATLRYGVLSSKLNISLTPGQDTSRANITRKMEIPGLLYGTAWKKERTKDLVYTAIKTGFRGIDTACQPKHYFEPGVGEALQQLYNENIVSRGDLFIQTKFTPIRGQDPNNVPYNPNSPLEEQVKQSFEVSCRNLNTDYLDSLVLHSPLNTISSTLTVWKVFEDIVQSGGARSIGISNCYDLSVLTTLYDSATIKPSYLQNRFYAETDYDKEIRKYCKDNGIQYQSFWTLTANPRIVRSSAVLELAAKYSKTPEQIFFKFVRSQGIVILTGTTSTKHMKEDLEILEETFQLEPSEIDRISSML